MLEPPHDCPLCPRLVEFRAANREKFPAYFNAPVPCFGPRDGRLLIAGLAPGLHGANATGRPFTGDWAGDLLYATLLKHGLARGVYKERADDGFELVDCRIVNAVRCVPPQNKPEPSEIKMCRQFLTAEIGAMTNLRVILALGKIAHDSVLKALEIRLAAHPFKHGAVYSIPLTMTGLESVIHGKTRLDGRVKPAHGGKVIKLISSYHCSRYNTNTRVLTTRMFEDVVGLAKGLTGA
jgi:uracil-DNA glycosylase family 4